jgi:glycosyltransferase involved in cell wall biosynthesis
MRNNDEVRSPQLSVILCTRNPRRDILELVLDSLRKQTLSPLRWELIVVDNRSSLPPEIADLNRGGGLPMRIVREEEIGLTPARQRGVREAAADVIVLVDDDNILDADYLESALDIAASHPDIGAFGGESRAMVEGGELRQWQKKLIAFLGVRDHGRWPITSDENRWGLWEPIGAGMVVRKDVAKKFIESVQTRPQAARLDRSGADLLSGGDSLIARSAYGLGYSCSYQPRLKLGHVIKKGRLRAPYLARLLYEHGRSFVILNNVLDTPVPRLSRGELLTRLPYRCKQNGFAGAIHWAWDLGCLREMNGANHGGTNGNGKNGKHLLVRDSGGKNGSHLPELSVILCLQKPRRDILNMVLEGLERQTLGKSRWELIVVANPLDEKRMMTELNREGSPPLRVVRESSRGMTAALGRGVSEAKALVVVVVNEDAILDSDYLESALRLSQSQATAGIWSGVAKPLPEGESVSAWKGKLIPFLGACDFGGEPMMVERDEGGRWKPMGAGLVMRKGVAQRLVELLKQSPRSAELDRGDNGLLSGEDSLIAQAAFAGGYSCSYQPRLKLGHFIRKSRFHVGHLARSFYRDGRSSVISNNLLGRPNQKMSRMDLLLRLPYRCIREGLSGAILWSWDIGCLMEARSASRRKLPATAK